jgi:guanine deaminase
VDPQALPERGPFALRARVLTPLTVGGTRHEPDGMVAVDEAGRLSTVGPMAAHPDLAATAIDIRPWLVMPGLVDLHAHLPQVPNAGLGFSLDLLTWLERLTFPTERAWADPAVAERLAPATF